MFDLHHGNMKKDWLTESQQRRGNVDNDWAAEGNSE